MELKRLIKKKILFCPIFYYGILRYWKSIIFFNEKDARRVLLKDDRTPISQDRLSHHRNKRKKLHGKWLRV